MRRVFPVLQVLPILLALWSPALLGALETAVPLRLESHQFRASSGEVVEAERGWITVPANRSRRDSGSIELAFVRFASTASEPGSPIVYLAGGPGGSGIGTARGSRFPLFMALREVADVIAFDQRGTGISKPFSLCQHIVQLPPERPIDRDEITRELQRKARECAESLRSRGIDLNGLNTEESADDLDALRRAIGAEKISLWGISYGTHLALSTIRRHGDVIDMAILAGIEGPDHTLKPPSQQQDLLEKIAQIADGDPQVRSAVPGLIATMEMVLERLGKRPAVDTLVDPRSGQKVKVALGRFDLQYITANMLRGPSSFLGIVDFYARLADGDWRALALARLQFATFPLGRAMSHTMDCSSGSTAERLERIAREAETTLLGDAINFPHPQLCAGWSVTDLGDDFRAPVRSDVPTLFISGTLDGRTPPENAEEVLQGFRHASHLVIDGAGHSDPLFLSSPQILDTMLAFLHHRTLPTTRIELPPVRLIPPRTVVALEPRVLQRYAGTYRIDEKSDREVLLAGDQLYTIRDGGRPQAIRPTSETSFFYEGGSATLDFHLSPGGAVSHMTVTQSGSSQDAKRLDD